MGSQRRCKGTMANRTISKKECQGIREVFLLFDDDNSGHLTVKQVRSFLHPFVPDLSPCKLNGNIGLLDAEENAIVDFDDFYALVASLPIEYSKDALSWSGRCSSTQLLKTQKSHSE